MPFSASVYEVLIASPSDVCDERDVVRTTILDWNAHHSPATGCVFLPVMWETHSTPEMGDEAQAICNRQFVDRCDALVGIFWTKIGTTTSNAISGTVEEIDRFRAAGKRVSLFFSKRKVEPDNIDEDQWRNVRRYREECKGKGLFQEFDTSPDLAEKVNRLLTALAAEIRQGKPLKKSEPDGASATNLSSVGDNLRSSIIWALGDWNTEKSCKPARIEDGREILDRLCEELRSFRVYFDERLPEARLSHFDDVIRDLRGVQRQEVYIDRKSKLAFWDKGDFFIERARKLGIEVARAIKSIEHPKYDGRFLGYSTVELMATIKAHLLEEQSQFNEIHLGELGPPPICYCSGELIHFREFDERLDLPPGTSSILLRDVSAGIGWGIGRVTENTIEFT